MGAQNCVQDRPFTFGADDVGTHGLTLLLPSAAVIEATYSSRISRSAVRLE